MILIRCSEFFGLQLGPHSHFRKLDRTSLSSNYLSHRYQRELLCIALCPDGGRLISGLTVSFIFLTTQDRSLGKHSELLVKLMPLGLFGLWPVVCCWRRQFLIFRCRSNLRENVAYRSLILLLNKIIVKCHRGQRPKLID